MLRITEKRWNNNEKQTEHDSLNMSLEHEKLLLTDDVCALFIVAWYSGLEWSRCSMQVLGSACFFHCRRFRQVMSGQSILISSTTGERNPNLTHSSLENSHLVTACSARTKPCCCPLQKNKDLRPEAFQHAWPSSPLWPFSVPSIPCFYLCVILASTHTPLWKAGTSKNLLLVWR